MKSSCHRFTAGLLLAIAASFAAPSFAQTPPCAQVGGGKICGRAESRDGYSANVYLGIRYATAGRFENPVLQAPSGTLEATRAGDVCPQVQGQNAVGSEDCLFLNIWTPPTVAPNAKLPVLFYIHGGAFVEGGSTPVPTGGPLLFDGLELANLGGPKNGVYPPPGMVVVTINYRLGPLGFLTYSDATGSATGNYGFLDQIAALQWVQKYIGAFGGDPGQVTLAGQSAGAISVGYHAYSSSQSSGLFQRSILESNPLGIAMLTKPQATAVARNMVGEMSCSDYNCCLTQNSPNPPNFKCLKDPSKVPASELAGYGFGIYGQYLTDQIAGGMLLLPWGPNLDGVLLKNQPLAGVRSAAVRPMIVGTNHDEGVFFSALLPIAEQEYSDFLVSLFGKIPANLPQVYQCHQASCKEQFAQVITDYVFTCANHALLEARPQTAPSWAYQFIHIPSWGYPAPPGVSPNPCATAVCHSAELPFVWDSAAGAGGSFTPAESKLSDQMARFWAALAAQGDPNKAHGGFVPLWPLYRGADYTLFKTGSLGLTNTLAAQANCGYWDRLGYPGIPGTGRVD